MEILFTPQSPLAHVRLLFLQISEHHGRNSQHQPTNQWSTRSHSTLPSPFVRRLFITHSLSLRKSFTTQSPPMHENHYSPSILSHIPPFPLLKSHSHQPPPNLRTIQLQTSKHHPSTRIIRNLNPKTLTQPNLLNMCLTSMLQQQIAARRSRRFARKAAKLARNDHQRLNENLLRIALKRPKSLNSLTGREPTSIVVTEPGGF